MRNFKSIIIVIAILFFGVIYAKSQTVLVDEKPSELYKVSKWGKNRKNFTHFYLALGSVVSQPEGRAFEITPGLSNQVKFGLRYKLRFCNFYAWGLDLSISGNRNLIKQNTNNFFPDSLKHEKEVFKYQTIGLEYFNRFNFGRRGNQVGKFLDLGAWGNWLYSPQHIFWDEHITPVNGASKSKTILSDLNYTTDFHWGVSARLGINRWVIYGSYRMSDIFNSKFHTQTMSVEPSRLIVGVEVGFF